MIVNIDDALFDKLEYLGILGDSEVRKANVGASNYSDHIIQAWSIWLDYPELTEFDKDIIKRVLRTKKTDSRRMDYEKIIHICKERIRQIDVLEKQSKRKVNNKKPKCTKQSPYYENSCPEY